MKINVFVIGPFQVNTILLWNERTSDAYLVDPGGEHRVVRRFIEKERLNVRAILATHGHVDHVAGVREFQKEMKLPYLIHPAERENVMGAEMAARLFGFRIDGVPTIDGDLTDGQVLPLGDESLTLLHTPGHSEGGLCFLNGTDLICGDTIFAGSVGRTDFPGGDWPTLLNSIRTRILTLPDEVRLIPGHGPNTSVGRERRTNPFLQGD